MTHNSDITPQAPQGGKPLGSWRCWALYFITLAGLLCLLSSPAEDCVAWMAKMLAVKAAGFALLYTAWRLAHLWDKRGQLPELHRLISGED